MTLMADELAERFHETYERLAPHYGYGTRPESAVPWEQVPKKNRDLMTAVCAEVMSSIQIDVDMSDLVRWALIRGFIVGAAIAGIGATIGVSLL